MLVCEKIANSFEVSDASQTYKAKPDDMPFHEALKTRLAVKYVQLLGRVTNASGYAHTLRYTQLPTNADVQQPSVKNSTLGVEV